MTIKIINIVIKRGKVLIVLSLFFSIVASAQHLSNQVIAPLGDVISKEGIFYSHTIGEAAVELFSTYGYDLTQGFQQPLVKFIPGTKPQGTGVNVYPNPAIDNVYVEFFGSQRATFSILVININGMIVFSDEVSFIENYWQVIDIPVSTLSIGIYFVRVRNEEGTISRSFKIEKM